MACGPPPKINLPLLIHKQLKHDACFPIKIDNWIFELIKLIFE